MPWKPRFDCMPRKRKNLIFNTVNKQECYTVNEQVCNYVQEQQCRTATDTVNEQQCSTENEQVCKTVFEKVCYSKPFGNSYGSPRLQNRSAQMFLGNNVEMCLDQFPDRGVTMFQSNNADMFQNSPA